MAGYSNDELIDIIDNEGLGYAVYGYLNPNPEKFEDPITLELWYKAHVALKDLAEHLGLED